MFLTGLSKKPDIYERLARAIAPTIYEKEDVKEEILLQLFGGNRKDFSCCAATLGPASPSCSSTSST